MARKCSRFEISIRSLLFAAAVLSGAASASGYHLPSPQVPVIPLNGDEGTPDTHEFVRCLTQVFLSVADHHTRL